MLSIWYSKLHILQPYSLCDVAANVANKNVYVRVYVRRQEDNKRLRTDICMRCGIWSLKHFIVTGWFIRPHSLPLINTLGFINNTAQTRSPYFIPLILELSITTPNLTHSLAVCFIILVWDIFSYCMGQFLSSVPCLCSPVFSRCSFFESVMLLAGLGCLSCVDSGTDTHWECIMGKLSALLLGYCSALMGQLFRAHYTVCMRL